MKRFAFPALLSLSLFLIPAHASAQVPEAQTAQLSEPTSVSTERSVVRQLEENARVEQVGASGQVVVSRSSEQGRQFALYDASGGTSVELPFVASRKKSGLTDYGIYVERGYVIYRDYTRSICLYDIDTGETRELTTPRGRLTNASVSSADDVVLQVFDRENNPYVYLQREGKEKPTYVGEGSIGRWSPDGQFFLMKPADSQGRWMLYDQNGEPMLDLRRYGVANWVRWAPTGEKLVFWPLDGEVGLYIVDLTRRDGEIAVDRARYIIPPEEASYTLPKWSPDGDKIAFHKAYMGDQTGYRTELVILDVTTSWYYLVGSGYGAGLRGWNWGTDTSIIAEAPLGGEVPHQPSKPRKEKSIYEVEVGLKTK